MFFNPVFMMLPIIVGIAIAIIPVNTPSVIGFFGLLADCLLAICSLAVGTRAFAATNGIFVLTNEVLIIGPLVSFALLAIGYVVGRGLYALRRYTDNLPKEPTEV